MQSARGTPHQQLAESSPHRAARTRHSIRLHHSLILASSVLRQFPTYVEEEVIGELLQRLKSLRSLTIHGELKSDFVVGMLSRRADNPDFMCPLLEELALEKITVEGTDLITARWNAPEKGALNATHSSTAKPLRSRVF